MATSGPSICTGLRRLDGFTIAVKNNIAVKGEPLTCGSKILKNFVPNDDAFVLDCCRKDGAEVIGTVSLDEFGMGSYGAYNPINGITVNPWRATDGICVPGGSSGGSAVAVSTGRARIALGTDTGGSIRLPASYCGVVGFKPTYGRLSRTGMTAYASSLDTVGVMASNIEDASVAIDVMSQYDESDAACIPGRWPKLTDFIDSLKGLNIGLPKECYIDELSQDAKTAWLSAADQLAAAGANITLISLPTLKHALPCYVVLSAAEASSNLSRYTGMFFGSRPKLSNSYTSFRTMFENTRTSGFGPEVVRRILVGTFTLSRNSYESFYAQAQRVRRIISNDFSTCFENKIDALLMPVASTDAPLISDILGDSSDVLSQFATDVFTVGPSLAGLPAVSIPFQLSKRRMPIGVQLVGQRFHDHMVASIARVLQHEVAFPNLYAIQKELITDEEIENLYEQLGLTRPV
eukprot:gene4108-43_t